MKAKPTTLIPEMLQRMDAYWRAANYLSVGQIYLYDNPLLNGPLSLERIKPLVVGYWHTVPGQNFIDVYLNRSLKQYELAMIYVSGPGHGGPAIVGDVYLEGTSSEVYPAVTQDEAGLNGFSTEFSCPGGLSSHVAPTTPGSIREDGELGYSLLAAFDIRVRNELYRFNLVPGVIDRLAHVGPRGAYLKQQMRDALIEHKHGRDVPPVHGWQWGQPL
ncbi:MAG: hypothetical protein WBL23_08705 [Salinisphaera sp.]